MSYVIVFNDKSEMEASTDESHIPDGVFLDYLDDEGKLSGIKHYVEDFPNFLAVTKSKDMLYKIFSSMPEEWRRDSWEDEIGEYIYRIRPTSLTNILQKIEAIKNSDREDVNEYKWKAPTTWAVSNNDIIGYKGESPTPLIDGLLHKGESLLISGSAGIGKSLLVNYLAYAVANIKTLWDQYNIPKPLISLTVQAEVDGHAQRARITKLIAANPEFKSDRVYTLGKSYDFFDCRASGWLDNPEFQASIVDAINASGADILFIDPLISFNPSDENNNTQMRTVLDSFMEGIQDTEVGVVVIHHTKKDGSGTRGASAIRDWTANALELELDRVESGEALIKVIHDKARNFAQIDPFYITRTKGLSFELAESKATRKEDERLKCVIDALTDAGGRVEGQKQFVKLISEVENGVKERTARGRIRDARDCGLIVEIDQGHIVPKVYLFPEK